MNTSYIITDEDAWLDLGISKSWYENGVASRIYAFEDSAINNCRCHSFSFLVKCHNISLLLALLSQQPHEKSIECGFLILCIQVVKV